MPLQGEAAVGEEAPSTPDEDHACRTLPAPAHDYSAQRVRPQGGAPASSAASTRENPTTRPSSESGAARDDSLVSRETAEPSHRLLAFSASIRITCGPHVPHVSTMR